MATNITAYNYNLQFICEHTVKVKMKIKLILPQAMQDQHYRYEWINYTGQLALIVNVVCRVKEAYGIMLWSRRNTVHTELSHRPHILPCCTNGHQDCHCHIFITGSRNTAAVYRLYTKT